MHATHTYIRIYVCMYVYIYIYIYIYIYMRLHFRVPEAICFETYCFKCAYAHANAPRHGCTTLGHKASCMCSTDQIDTHHSEQIETRCGTDRKLLHMHACTHEQQLRAVKGVSFRHIGLMCVSMRTRTHRHPNTYFATFTCALYMGFSVQ
jgi:hypothetical protein